MQSHFEKEVEKLQSLQKQQQKTASARQLLEAQLQENQLVKDEMLNLEDGSKIFKLIGPALLRQETSEAKSNVDKRINYITGEIKRHDDLLKDLEKKLEESRSSVQSLQTQIQRLKVS